MADPARTDQRLKAGEGAAFRLRPEQPGDADFLLHLFCETRRDILAGLDPPLVEMLLRQQHTGQTMTYRANFAAAHFDIVVDLDGLPIGRLVVDDRPSVLHVVDIALLPAASGRGLGTALVAATMRRAAESGRGVTASVRDTNLASRAMFSRLGFVLCPSEEGNLAAAWRPSSAAEINRSDTLSNES